MVENNPKRTILPQQDADVVRAELRVAGLGWDVNTSSYRGMVERTVRMGGTASQTDVRVISAGRHTQKLISEE